MMKQIQCAIALIFLQFAFSQNKGAPELQDTYSEYFELPREKVFLHLNKTCYLQGEDIWFTAYLYEPKTGMPFNKTSNLYCGLYNSEGKQLTNALFYVNNGIATGHFEIKPSYGSGDVFIKAHTNGMKNFKEDDAYVQQIKILDNINQLTDADSVKAYDIQLLAEGGHLLSGARNTIGFKVVDQEGKSVAIGEGMVKTDDGKTVVDHILSDAHGIGKFNFEYEENTMYSFVAKLSDGKTITKKIPLAENRGVIFSVNNLLENKLAIAVHTNDKTLGDIKEKDFHLAIHRDGLLVMNSFTLDHEQKRLTFAKDKLWPGINIITLFDGDLKPIAERLIFNRDGVGFGKVAAKSLHPKKLKDSIKIQLNIYSRHNTPASLSLSILPQETLANNPSESIISAFLLRPYIKNQIENASYYFRDMNRKKSFELDNLLLVQGWSRYDWTDIFFNPPKEIFLLENGIPLTGKVKNANRKKNKIFLLEQSTNSQYVSIIDSTNHFKVSNGIVFKDTPVQAILFDSTGKPSKPEIELEAFPNIEVDTLDITKFISPYSLIQDFAFPDDFNWTTSENENIIALDNVTVSAEVQKRYFVTNNSMTGLKITDEKGTLSNFIRKLGFRTYIDPEDGLTYAFYTRGSEKFPVAVVMDGIYDLGFFERSMTNIEQVFYDQTHGPIMVISKKKKQLETIANYLVQEGFERPKEYYNPKYPSHNSQGYLDYGSVHWEPLLLVKKDGEANLTIPEYGLKNVKLFIEGIGQNGTFFSEIKTISLN